MAQTQRTPEKKTKAASYVFAVGRRKRAVARVRLYTKDTKSNNIDIMVNDKPIGQYFSDPYARLVYDKPLKLTNTIETFSVTVKVVGSGPSSQLEAVMHGIARALVKVDEANKKTLRDHGLLTRDPRERQRRMIGRGGRARAKKQSPKR